MKLLLDTHAFLWFIVGDEQLSPVARQLIEDTTNERYLSVVSMWEITIKSALGRLVVPTPPSKLIREHVWSNAIELLPLTPAHFDGLQALPQHHKDPFDRMLIAQALAEGMTLVTKDRTVDRYGVRSAWSSR